MTKKMTSEDNVVAAVSSTMLIEGELRNQSLHKGRRNEHPEKDPKNDAEINAGDLVHPFQHRSVISLMDRVLTWDNVKNLDPDVRLTRGYYYLVYRPKTSALYKTGRPFCIGQDMVRWNLNVSGYRMWKALCKQMPEFAWIDRHTHLDPFLFNIARMHPGITFAFCVDWGEYVRMLLTKAKEQGLSIEDMDGKPLLAHVPSKKMYMEKYRGKKALLLTRDDYTQTIFGVEHDDEIKSEMYSETGQTIDDVIEPCNRCAHDPKTGRFISKKQQQEMQQQEE